RMTQGAASGWLARGRVLRQLPALDAAAAAGRASAEQVSIVAKLGATVGMGNLSPFDRILGDLAAAAAPREVAHACERIHAHLDPDGAQPDPNDAFERRDLTLARTGAMTYLKGRLDPEGAALVHTVLDAYMRPPTADDLRTPGQRRADAWIEACRTLLARGDTPTIGGVRPHLGILVTPSALTGTQPTTGNDTEPAASAPPPPKPQPTERTVPPGASAEGSVSTELSVSVASTVALVAGSGRESSAGAQALAGTECSVGAQTDTGTECAVGAEALTDECRTRLPDPLERLGVPQLPELPWARWVGEIPPELAQRIACDCQAWRAILDPATGLPLEVGRAHRIVPTWIRKALQARDRGCRWPGCTAPAAWTDAHHLLPWWHGGRTDIDNLLLLCRYHHAKVHEGHWRIHLDSTTGELHVYRPDGQPYELAPSKPWTSPGRRTGDG